MSKEGSIAAQGSTVDVLQQPSVQSLFDTPSMENWQCPSSHSSTEESATTAPLQAVIPSTTSDSITQTDKRRQIGDSAVYGFYLRSAGWKPTIIFLVAMLIFTFCDAFPSKFSTSSWKQALILKYRYMVEVVGRSKHRRTKSES